MSMIVFAGDLHLAEKNPISRLDDYPTTMLHKLETILNIPAYAYFFAGDFFHTPNISKEYLVRVIETLKKHEDKDIYTIIGNHDVPFGKSDNISNSPLGILFATGLVKRLTTEVIDGWVIMGCDYDQVAPTPNPDDKSILVAHKFYMEYDEKEMITDDEADDFNYVFLGHDHTRHDKERNIYRVGSVSRMTGSKENTERDSFSVLRFDTKTEEFEPKEFPLSESVFNKVYLDIRREMKKESTTNMNKIFESVANESLEHVLELPNFKDFSEELKLKFLELYYGLETSK